MIHRIRDATIRPVISGVEPPRFWTQTSLVLELAITATAGVAGILTAGTLIQSSAGTARSFDPRHAALVWSLCACLAGVAVALGRHVPPGTLARHRRSLTVLLSAALIWSVLGMLRPVLGAADGLIADYFTNPDWNGEPAFSVVDGKPSTAGMRQRWDGVPPEQFSVRWVGFLTVGRSGLYNFTTTSDDGSQLIVDNHLVVDNTGPHSLRTRSGAIHLDGGSYPIALRYVQYGATSALDWSWSRDGGDTSPVPAWALSQHRTSYATVISARTVEWVLWSLAILIVPVAARYLRVGLSGEDVGRWAAARRLQVTGSYRNTPALVFSVFIMIAIPFMPWEEAGHYPFFKAVEGTIRTLNGTATTMLGRFEAFQADINNPQTDESILPDSVREMLSMLRRHDVDRYQLSDSIVANPWVFQQTVASAWPRKLEKDAKARFVLSGEPVIPNCQLIEKQREVSLVYCP